MAEKNSAQTNKQTDRQTNRHYENNGHLAVNQQLLKHDFSTYFAAEKKLDLCNLYPVCY